MQHNRVVISGIGLVTPLGNEKTTTWQGLVDGRSGISSLKDSVDVGDYPVSVAGLVKNEQALIEKLVPTKFHSRTDRFIHLSILAGNEAMIDAGLDKNKPEDRTRFGTYVGVGVGGLNAICQTALQMQESGMRRVSPFIIPKAVNNLAPAWLSMLWDLQGPVSAITNACASSADAVGLAFRLIRDGYADYMLVGGTEACVVPIAIAGFGNMRALSQWDGDPAKASRPFEKNRAGFVIAEGGAMLVLERLESAQARNARMYAEIVGYGATSDAHHMTAMHPDGRGAANAMIAAMVDAGIDSSMIGYVNAHGTGTPMNDLIETIALKKVFGARADAQCSDRIAVSSTKSMTGHMLGAAGAAETAFTALSLYHAVLPPTINIDVPDPACDLDYIPHQARSASVDYALTNSFGFGGGNAVLALRRCF